LSRFRPDRGLSRLDPGSGQTVKVSPLLWQGLRLALDNARITDGWYDPTISIALVSAGCSRPFETRAGPPVPAVWTPTPQSGWEDVQLDPKSLTVTLEAGMGIYPGGISKRWIARQVADSLSTLGPCLVDAGGDIAAIGSPPGMEGFGPTAEAGGPPPGPHPT
jgi:thiamine biosynthesis lipoprotein